jgi:cathepsin C
MVGKQGYDYHLIPEDCFEYKGAELNCSAACAEPKYRVKIEKYEYIGGYYGANSELSMMEEIYKNGPIAINYLVYPDFHYYKAGIYKHHNKHRTAFNIKTSSKGVKHWEATTHAVAVIGWGEQDGEKYWIAKNSWGKRWGMIFFICI